MGRKPKHKSRPRRSIDPTLNPVRIMGALAPDERRRFTDALEREGQTEGPCMVCDTPTRCIRPIVILEPDSLELGAQAGESHILGIRLCPACESDENAGKARAAIVDDARRRRREGGGPRLDLIMAEIP